MTLRNWRWLLIVVLLAVQAGTAAVILLGLKDKTSEQMIAHAKLSLDHVGESIAHHIDHVIAPAVVGLKVGRRLVADGVLDPNNVRDLEHYFLAKLEADPLIAGLYVGRADGSFMMSTRNDEGVLSALVESYGGLRSVLITQRDENLDYLRTWVDPQNAFDPTEQPWYAAARQSDRAVMTSAYPFFESGVPGVTAAVELRYPDGSDAGVLGVDIDSGMLSSYMAHTIGSGGVSAILVDEHDQVIASSVEKLPLSPEAGNTIPTFSSVADKALQVLRQRIAFDQTQTRTTSGAMPASNQIYSFTADQETRLGLTRSISLGADQVDWTLLIQMPASAYRSDLSQLFDSKLTVLLATLGVTVLILLLGYFGLGGPTYRREQDAGLDPLTGALTRPEFERRLQGMLSKRRETEIDSRIYLVALDLDGFKALNDEYGEVSGDLVLSRFVARLTSKVRDSDLIGRNGGDEFVLAVQLDSDVDMLSTMERIRGEVVAKEFPSAAGLHQMSFTAGIACFDADESLDNLISRANQALVTGKARGRNRCYMAPNHHARWPETVVSAITAQHATRRDDWTSQIHSD
ncbi:MAG: diguanylate cyclase [Burkholderiaceae bacterium]